MNIWKRSKKPLNLKWVRFFFNMENRTSLISNILRQTLTFICFIGMWVIQEWRLEDRGDETNTIAQRMRRGVGVGYTILGKERAGSLNDGWSPHHGPQYASNQTEKTKQNPLHQQAKYELSVERELSISEEVKLQLLEKAIIRHDIHYYCCVPKITKQWHRSII